MTTLPTSIATSEIFVSGDPFVEFLKARRQKLFYLKPYLGNSGDDLIVQGTSQLLANFGIDTTVNPKLADVILWPGGNPTMWKANIEGWQDMWKRFPNTEFAVAPATFQHGQIDWVSPVKNEAKKLSGLFARDAQSYQNLKQANLSPSVAVGLSHDPALALRDTKWMRDHRAAATEEYVLLALRTDHEAKSSKPGVVNYAINWMPHLIARNLAWRLSRSAQAGQVQKLQATLPPGTKVVDWDVSTASFHVFVEAVRSAISVHTNRLHVMLLAAMLHKPVVIHPTAYGKLEAVYEHSLKGWANVSIAG